MLTIDIGNTTTSFVFFKDSHLDIILDKKTYLTSEIKAQKAKTMKFIYSFFKKNSNISFNAIISSVVPSIDFLIKHILDDVNTNSVVNLNDVRDIVINIDRNCKKTIGSDRVANMAGAYNIYKKSVAVADFGTATTISVVNNEGKFIGSSIMPGINMMLNCIHKGTAKLPLIKADKVFQPYDIDTSSAIKTGVILGTTGAIERFIKDIEEARDCKLQLVLTGGSALLISSFIKRSYELNPNLIFEGLRVIYERNYNE
ncbi:MAG TPA: type III pantothenate kinase [Nitrospirae bacterium]|nr:type III pantothenate kinase [Nitrospirota bacterium]